MVDIEKWGQKYDISQFLIRHMKILYATSSNTKVRQTGSRGLGRRGTALSAPLIMWPQKPKWRQQD